MNPVVQAGRDQRTTITATKKIMAKPFPAFSIATSMEAAN
jgi:hypothetical protein